MFKNLYYIAIFTLIVVVSWIAFEVYNSSVTSTITPDKSVIITPIPADFNQAMIAVIKSKKVIPADLSQTSSSSAAPTPRVQVTPEAQSSPSSITTQSVISPTITSVPGSNL